ncbi:YER152C [Saccharomyces arboricola H-6]|uniref:YER152C n=1 Tax=Saccharomyces arboricola (strain H-6 / AS 2.3317 / CBS 10644) TaxID=1160507 RepID=J8LPB3_SACAR|nr:YER152C [Saccharomyces arboricola H-6]
MAMEEINFFKGHPSSRLLPREAVVQATAAVLGPETREYDNDPYNRHPLTYGSDEGALWVREQICVFLNDQVFKFEAGARSRTQPEYLNLDSGASYGMLNILLQTTLPHNGYTRQAFVITPTYFLINDCFTDAGFKGKVTAINEKGHDSIDFESLVAALERHEAESRASGASSSSTEIIQGSKLTKKIYRYVMYCIPTFANPSGNTYSFETRHRLVDIARKYDMLVITDDVYDILDYTTPVDKLSPPPLRIVHIDRNTAVPDKDSFGNTVSNATFSKLIAPGLRFGYHETVNANLSRQLSKGGANVSGGTPSQLNSMIVGELLRSGAAQKCIAFLRSVYCERATVLTTALKKYMPPGTEISPLDGGYFTWITLPPAYNAVEISNVLAKKYNVILANGSNFEVVGDEKNWGRSSFRLSISFLETGQIEKGIELFGAVCKSHAASNNIIM